MVHSRGGRKRNKDRKKWIKLHDSKAPGFQIRGYKIPAVIPETTCEHCKEEGYIIHDNFDEHGYKIPKTIVGTGSAPRTDLESKADLAPWAEDGCFRFLDLPPEIRNRIYELVVYQPKQPVCVADRLLRPSEDLNDARYVLRQCHADVVCLPCQLHQMLGTGDIGLSRANQKLHFEMSLMTYAVNTFSLHNLYYLQMFLRLIGQEGRKCMKSLRFGWTLPEEEARALGMYTSVEETYTLLGQCSSLVELSVDMDPDNMMRWRGTGRQRSVPLTYLDEFPHIALVKALRGLKDIRIGWKDYFDLQGVAEWAATLAGLWRLPQGTEEVNAVPVEAEVLVSSNVHWHYIHWKAREESIVEV